jgi:CBS domain containing-hemolysin-like protein
MGYNGYGMFILLLSVTIVAFILLLVMASIKPSHSELSLFELRRRAELGDRDASRVLEREYLLNDVVSLQHAITAVLIVVFTSLSILSFGWIVGLLVAFIVALEHRAIARFGFIRTVSKQIYRRIEPAVIRFVNKKPYVVRLLKSVSSGDDVRINRLGSSAELSHLVDESDDVLTSDEKKLIVNGLSFGNKLVESVMTPRNMIRSIKKSEFLGPLALNDLHKVGHSRLPVIKDDIDHIVGILYLDRLLALDTKKSTTAEKAMDSKVIYIRDNQTLNHALTAFLRTHHHILVVVNQSRETVGLLTLKDVIEELIGHKIVDKFDPHDDL